MNIQTANITAEKLNELTVTTNQPVYQNGEKENKEEIVIDPVIDAGEANSHDAYRGHLAAIIESSEDAIISKTLNGVIRSWNKSAEKMFGYTSEEAIGKNISLIIPEDCLDEEKDILKRIRNNEIIEHSETVRVKKNGEKFYVSLTVSPIKDRNGKIIGVSKIAHDITAQKKSANELDHAIKELVLQNEAKEKQAAELIIANKALIFQNEEKEKRAAELIVANKELAFQNEEKEKRAAELIIANKELIFQNEEKVKRAAELIIAKNIAAQNEEKAKRAAELIIANKELVLQNEEKEKRATELTIAIRDIKTSEQQIIEVNKELESFAYSVSHDLRAPLRAVNGYAKMLKENYGTQFDPEATRLMGNIMNNAKKMGQLIDDLLRFSRIARKDMAKIEIRMFDMITNISNELRKEQPERNIEFRIGHILPAQVDNNALKQVWINLISNAIKYSKFRENTIIEIGSIAQGSETVYYIKDNGAGFDMRYVHKLFNIFQRLHSEEEFEGTGIGLAIVQRIIFKHGGRIWAEGSLNEGATFYFTLNKI